VAVEVSEEAGVRYLHFGSRWVQGAMRVARPFALELEYTRAMMLPLLLRGGRDWPRQVLLIGLGAASLAKFLYRHRPRATLTVVEIEPRVVAAARQFFRVPDDPRRLAIEIGNGDAWIAAHERTFDLVLVDGFDARGSPGSLDSSGFYARCRTRLSARGLVATNLLARSRGVAPSLARLRQAFDDRVRALVAGDAGNTVAIAAAGDPVEVRGRELVARAAALHEATGLDLRRFADALVRDAGGPAGVLSI